MNGVFDSLPSFQGNFINEYDCRDGCCLRLYDGVKENGYREYISALAGNGYEILQERNIEGNLFAALQKDISVTVFYTPCDGTLRITAQEGNHFPSFTPGECERKCQPVFYAFENDRTLIDCGMCLMIQCPDYSFFIVDSGHYFQPNDNDRIHKFMRERTPEGQKIIINGWFITHAHTDHISKLMDFLKYNCGDVVIEGFYENLLPADYPNEDGNHEEPEMAAKLFTVLAEHKAPKYKLHTGEKFYIRNMSIEVLSTHEDIYPQFIEDYNDSSTVIMVEAEGTKIFIPGDAAVLADRQMLKRFKSTLKADVVQIAHHGHTGLSAGCYERIGADTAVFPVTRIFFDAELPRHEANRKAVEIAHGHYITGDGTVCVPLPYDRETVKALPGETFEDFEKIKRLWRYVYTDERKAELYEIFLSKGGNLENTVIPTSPTGWIEPKPPIDE